MNTSVAHELWGWALILVSVSMLVAAWIALQVERVWSRAHRLWQAWRAASKDPKAIRQEAAAKRLCDMLARERQTTGILGIGDSLRPLR